MSWFGDHDGHVQAAILGWMHRGIEHAYQEISTERSKDPKKNSEKRTAAEKARVDKVKNIVNGICLLENMKTDELDEEKKITNNVINTAMKFYGTTYLNGGEDTDGIDCSGLIKKAWEPYLEFEHSASDQASSENTTDIDIQNLRRSDLIFFNGIGSTNIDHVGIIVGKVGNKIFFFHASSSRGTMLSSLNDIASKTGDSITWADQVAKIRRPIIKK